MNLTEYYYNSGKMPLNYYNQLNGKTTQENYAAIKQKQQQDESFLMYVIRNSLQASLKTALNEIFKELKI